MINLCYSIYITPQIIFIKFNNFIKTRNRWRRKIIDCIDWLVGLCGRRNYWLIWGWQYLVGSQEHSRIRRRLFKTNNRKKINLITRKTAWKTYWTYSRRKNHSWRCRTQRWRIKVPRKRWLNCQMLSLWQTYSCSRIQWSY